MTKKQIILNIFLVLFGFFMLYLDGIVGIFYFLSSILLYSVFFYLFYYLWKKLRKKENKTYKEYLPYFLEKISGSLLLLIIILGGLSYYSNEINPTKIETYYLSDGDKKVIFQGMIHIGTESFYSSVVKKIKESKEKGYVLFFEGVKPGSKENHDKFNKAIGVEFKKDLYENLSKLYGLSNQNNQDFLLLVNNLDFNIDLSIDEIINNYEKIPSIKKKQEVETNPRETKKTLDKEEDIPIDLTTKVIEILSELNERELEILIYINKGIINFIVQNESFRTFVTNNLGKKELFDVILDKRNEVLANAIISSKYKKIIVTYGIMHFKGVLELLKQNDNKWKIEKIEYLYPIG